MRVKEQAISDLNQCLKESRDSSMPLNYIALRMKQFGWQTVNKDNLLDTARGLGFTVVGTTIYPWGTE
jgi:hypothetical protein